MYDNALQVEFVTLRPLPQFHLERIRSLESAYLAHSDPIRQSGFGGGARRWRSERSPLLEAVDADGEFLDVGCAVGHLLECVVDWGNEHGIELTPYGIDLNPKLIREAIRRFPAMEHHFWVANAWNWIPPRRFKWVYALYDCVPDEYVPALAKQLLTHSVADGGRLIMGAYGSVSQQLDPADIAGMLRAGGLRVAGQSCGGTLPDGGPVTRFAWMDRSANLDR